MPLKIGFTGKSFKNPYTALNGSSSITISRLKLLWAATTVGRANYAAVFSNGMYSWYQCFSRALTLAAYLGVANNRLVQTSAYKGLDPSEKGSVSYFLGMAVAKLMASEHFGVHWPLHYDIYKPLYAIAYKGTRRPDLIGVNPALDWAVIESKGRSNSSSMKYAKSQKPQVRAIKTINTKTPFVKFVSVSHFSNGNLRAFLVDPDDHDKDAIDLEVPSGPDFFRLYYREIRDAIAFGPKESWRRATGLIDFEGMWIPDAELGFGLHKRVLREWGSERLAETATSMPYYKAGIKFVSMDQDQPIESFCGPDGIAVAAGPRFWQMAATAEFKEQS